MDVLTTCWEPLTVTLNDFGTRLRSASVEDTTPMWHGVLVWILNSAVIVKRVDYTQVEQHAIQHLHMPLTHSPSSHCSLTGVTSFHVLSTTTKLHTCTTVKHQYITARLVSDMRKFDRSLWQLMRVDLHWLGVSERVKFKLMSMVHKCIHHKAPR